MINVLQISDLHLLADTEARLLNVLTQQSFEVVLEQALAERSPDAVLVTGDIAHEPSVAVYERFLRTVQRFTSAPLVCLPGNHDVGADMSAANLPIDPVRLDNWLVLPLDSHIDEVTEAEFSDDAVRRLRDAYAEETAHMLVAVHHPLTKVDCPWLDKDRIQSETLVEWLATHPGVAGVAFGHTHQIVEHELPKSELHAATTQSSVKTAPLHGAPSTCFQFAAGSQRFTVDRLPPGYRWWQLGPQGECSSTAKRVRGYPVDPKIERRH